MDKSAVPSIEFHVLTEKQAELVNERISDFDRKMYMECQLQIQDAVQELRECQRDLIDCERDLRDRYAPEIAEDRPE